MIVPEHSLFPLARQVVSGASLARTLAHCLYWFQHARHQIEGEPAIYKTAKEVEQAIGIHFRSASRHFRQLADEGFWRVAYRPRPGGISRVTWLVPLAKSRDLISSAQQPLFKARSHQRAQTASSGDTNLQLLAEAFCDPRMSQDATAIQFHTQLIGNQYGKDDFIEGPRRKINRNVKGPPCRQSSDIIDPHVKKWIDDMNLVLFDRGLPNWNVRSRYTDFHAAAFLAIFGKQESIPKGWSGSGFIERLLSCWPSLINELPWRYANFPDNRLRPSPMALADNADLILQRMLSLETYNEGISAPSSLKGLDQALD
jgi:hypothetical protein